MPFIDRGTVIQELPDSFTLLAPAPSMDEQVKISFLGAIDLGRVGEPSCTDDGVLQVASLDDLMATKVKVRCCNASSRKITATLRH